MRAEKTSGVGVVAYLHRKSRQKRRRSVLAQWERGRELVAEPATGSAPVTYGQ